MFSFHWQEQGGARDLAPGPISLIFMQYLGKIWANNRLVPPPWVFVYWRIQKFSEIMKGQYPWQSSFCPIFGPQEFCYCILATFCVKINAPKDRHTVHVRRSDWLFCVDCKDKILLWWCFVNVLI